MFVNVQVTGDPAPTAPEADAPPPGDAHAECDAADVPFSAGNPSVEHVTGVVHLYRHVGVDAGAAGANTSGDVPAPSALSDDDALTDQLAVLALPDDVSVGDLCDFLGEHLPSVRKMRLVRRDAAAARGAGGAARLALLRFATPAAADEAYAAVNGRPFTVLEPDAVCRLVRVKGVTLERTGGGAADAPLPLPPPPPPGAIELPPCPVCLERLDDDVSGVVTTVCNHDFHTRCLSAWGGAACPVCRYATAGAPGPPCAVCGASADLWICLICGHVGCGRYAAGHAARHAADAAHFYSLEVGTGRVWDYAADGYVHRLVQSAALGKLVEVPRGAAGGGGDAGASASGASGAAAPRSAPAPPGAFWCAPPADPGDAATLEALAESKADAVAAQYSALLAGQLDAQRAFFESELAAARADAAAARDAAAAADAARLAAVAAVEAERTDAARAAERARAADAKAAAATAAAAAATAEAADVRALNEGLASAAADLRATIAAERATAAARTADLEEQVRDLALSLDAGAAIAAGGGSGGEGGAGGTLLPVPPPPPAGRGRRVARGRR